MTTIAEKLETIYNCINRMKTAIGVSDNTSLEALTTAVESGGGDTPSSSSGIYLYKTVEEMNASTGHLDTDIAVVLDSTEVPITSGMEFSNIILPKDINFSEPLTDVFIDAMIHNDNTPIDGRITIMPDMINFNVYFMDEGIQIMANYTTEDNQTFTLDYYDGFEYTDGTVSLPEGTYIDLWEYEDIFGEAFKMKEVAFEGIFSLTLDGWAFANVGITTKENAILSGHEVYSNSGKIAGTLGEVMDPTLVNKDYIQLAEMLAQPLPSDYTNSLFSGYQGEHLEILKLLNLNTTAEVSLSHFFYACTNLLDVDLRNLDTSTVTNIEYMFGLNESLEYIDISHFNSTNITNANGICSGCKKLKEIQLCDLNSTGYECMFLNCGNLITVDGTKLRVSKTDACIRTMFTNAKLLEEIDIRNIELEVSNLFNVSALFEGCTNLKKIDMRGISFTTTLSNWTFLPPNKECLIIVKDDATKTYLTTNWPDYTNIKTVAEYEGGTE